MAAMDAQKGEGYTMTFRGTFFHAAGQRLLAGSCVAALAAFSQPALAQSAAPAASPAPEEPAPQSAPTQQSGIQDIVVTARFVSENLQDTPVAITAQTAEQLTAANVTNIGTLGGVVPNLQTVPGDSQSAGTPLVRIRGVIQGASSSIAVPPAVAIYTDDIYHATTAGSELDFTDIDHLEVNRGPQSTLSGNASIGGSIKLYTKDPIGDNSGYIAATGGSRKKLGIGGAIDLGLSPTLSVRFSGNFERQDGFFDRLDFTCQMRKNGTPQLAGSFPVFSPASANHNCVIGQMGGGTTAVGQVKLRWQPTEGVDLILTARHREEDLEETPELALLYVANPNPNTSNALVESFNAAVRAQYGIQLDDRFLAPPGNRYSNYATNCRPLLPTLRDATGKLLPSGYCFDQGKSADNTVLSAKLNVDFSDTIHMTAIAGYTKYSNAFTQNGDQSPLGYVTSHFENSDSQYSGELRFNGSLFDDKLQWVLGGFLLRFTGHQDNNIYFLTTAQDSKVRGTNDNQSGFFHLDYNITDRWRVSGGARYTDGTLGITINNPAGVSILTPSKTITHRWDWLISTDYKVTDDILAYASVATGSRPGGLTTIVNTPRQLTPTPAEELIAYEAGVKADFFDRRLRMNLSAFYTDYKKVSFTLQGFECVAEPTIVFHPIRTECNAFANNGSVNYFISVGIPAKIRGLEWEISALPTDNLHLDWSGGYNKYTSGIKTPGQAGYNFPGNHRQPTWNMHADAYYDFETSIGTFTPRLDWTWQSQQDYDPSPQLRAPQAIFIIKPYSIYNAQFAYESPDKDWSATLSVANLANKFYNYQVLLGTLDAQTRVAPPREFSLTVRRKF